MKRKWKAKTSIKKLDKEIKTADTFKTRVKWLVNLMDNISELDTSVFAKGKDQKTMDVIKGVGTRLKDRFMDYRRTVGKINTLYAAVQRNARAWFTDKKTGKVIDQNVKAAQTKFAGTVMKNADDKDFHNEFVTKLESIFKREGTAEKHDQPKQMATIVILSRLMPDFKYPQASIYNFRRGAPLKQYNEIIDAKRKKLEEDMSDNDKKTWNDMYQNFFAKPYEKPGVIGVGAGLAGLGVAGGIYGVHKYLTRPDTGSPTFLERIRYKWMGGELSERRVQGLAQKYSSAAPEQQEKLKSVFDAYFRQQLVKEK